MVTETTAEIQSGITEWLEERQGRFISIADEIWRNPELGLAEFKACLLQSDDLAADGFTITGNIGGMPTAFMAEWSQGEDGPIIGFLGEYDALPGLSQKIQDTQDALEMGGAGHGCGHNLLGTAALASASVLKSWLEHTGTAATVRYYGCPAEETFDGKVFMARAGAFDDLDLALTWHPGSLNTVSATSSLAVNNISYRFHGRTAHAAANPETGRSSLDAVELMNVGVNFLREHMPEKARIHYVITNGGGAPNVVPDDAEVWYFIRSPDRQQVEELTKRVSKIAQGAAMMTETTLEEKFGSGTYNLLYNDVVGEVLYDVLQSLGPIAFTEEEHAFARTVVESFPADLRASLLDKRGLPDDILDQSLNGDVWPIMGKGESGGGSTDVSDVSWIAPTGQVTTTTWALAIPGHSWAVTATGAMSIGHKGMLHAAKALATAAATFVLDPALLQRAKDEFAESTAGRPYTCPIPDHIMPPKPEEIPS